MGIFSASLDPLNVWWFRGPPRLLVSLSSSSPNKVSLTFPFSCIQRITLKVSKSEISINFSSMKNDKLEGSKNSWLVFWTLSFSCHWLLQNIFHLFTAFLGFQVLSQFQKSSNLIGKMALKNWVGRPLSPVLSIISVDKKLWMASRALHVLWLVEVAAPFSAATTEIQKTTTLTRNENDRHRSEISNDGNSCKKLELWIFSHYLAFMLR